MKKMSYRVIERKDTDEKIRVDALNKIIDDKIKTTPELSARQAKTREEENGKNNHLDNVERSDAFGLPSGGN